MAEYRTLFTLRVTHAYHDGICPDVSVALPAEGRALLARGRLLAKPLGGALVVLYEADSVGRPLVSISDQTLRLGVVVDNSVLANVTDAAAWGDEGLSLWSNSTAEGALEAGAEKYALVGAVFRHALVAAARPLRVTLDAANGVRHADTTVGDPERTGVSFDLSLAAPGPYHITESASGLGEARTPYFVHPELASKNLLGLIEIRVAPAFYSGAAAPVFELALAARSETLCYHLLVSGYDDAELDALAVHDAGAVDEQRPVVEFSRVASDAASDPVMASLLARDPAMQLLSFHS